MALNISINHRGIPVTYWRIVGYNVSITGQMAQIFMLGYLSRTERELNQHFAATNHIIKRDHFDEYIIKDEHSNIIANLYGFLKDHVPEFQNAEDIFEVVEDNIGKDFGNEVGDLEDILEPEVPAEEEVVEPEEPVEEEVAEPEIITPVEGEEEPVEEEEPPVE